MISVARDTLKLDKPREPRSPKRVSQGEMRRTLRSIEKPVTAIEKRKMNHLVRQAVALEILRGGDYQLRHLDEELMPTHRVLQRWAAGSGTGLPIEEVDTQRASRPPPLDDATHIVVEGVIMRGNATCRMLIREWYRAPTPTTTMAKNMGLSQAGLYMQWRAALHYYRSEFRATRHMDLVRMLEDFDPVY